jgi:hypothetical protein
MARPAGYPKTGGRQKGKHNRRTEELLSVLRSFNYDPLKSILEKYDGLPQVDQLKIDLKLLEYVYPKLKEQAIESLEPASENRVQRAGEVAKRLLSLGVEDTEAAKAARALCAPLTPLEVAQAMARIQAEFLK